MTASSGSSKLRVAMLYNQPVLAAGHRDAESEHDIEANRVHILEQQLARIQCEKTKKWNFDFDAGKPLSGRYDWQTLERPSHPLPPPAATKRPADSDVQHASKRQRIQLSIRANQTKITGNDTFLFLFFFFSLLFLLTNSPRAKS